MKTSKSFHVKLFRFSWTADVFFLPWRVESWVRLLLWPCAHVQHLTSKWRGGRKPVHTDAICSVSCSSIKESNANTQGWFRISTERPVKKRQTEHSTYVSFSSRGNLSSELPRMFFMPSISALMPAGSWSPHTHLIYSSPPGWVGLCSLVM